MRQVRIGADGPSVSVLCLGTMTFGNQTPGAYGAAIGIGNAATGTSTIALGTANIASGNTAIAAGRPSGPAKPADGLLTAPHDHPIMDTLSVR